MPLPLSVLIGGGLAGGFAVGKLALSGGAGAAGDAAPIAGSADPSMAGTNADASLWGDSASLNYGWDNSGVGTLNGVTPGSGDPYGSGGLPGGGDPILPPDPTGGGVPGPDQPPVGFLPPNPPRPPHAPAGATRQVVANGLTRLWTLSGGVARPTTYQQGKHFSAWAGPSVQLRTASGSATFARIVSGVYVGKYVHTSDPGVSFR